MVVQNSDILDNLSQKDIDVNDTVRVSYIGVVDPIASKPRLGSQYLNYYICTSGLSHTRPSEMPRSPELCYLVDLVQDGVPGLLPVFAYFEELVVVRVAVADVGSHSQVDFLRHPSCACSCDGLLVS